jgi:hypothetical protein
MGFLDESKCSPSFYIMMPFARKDIKIHPSVKIFNFLFLFYFLFASKTLNFVFFSLENLQGPVYLHANLQNFFLRNKMIIYKKILIATNYVLEFAQWKILMNWEQLSPIPLETKQKRIASLLIYVFGCQMIFSVRN